MSALTFNAICTENDEASLLAVACENGLLCGFDTRSGRSTFSHRALAAANCVLSLSAQSIACGYQDGGLSVFDLRKFSVPSVSCSRSASAVLRLVAASQPHTLIASSLDGTITEWSAVGDSAGELLREFTGADCEAVSGLARCTSEEGDWLLSVADDGVARRFSL